MNVVDLCGELLDKARGKHTNALAPLGGRGGVTLIVGWIPSLCILGTTTRTTISLLLSAWHRATWLDDVPSRLLAL